MGTVAAALTLALAALLCACYRAGARQRDNGGLGGRPPVLPTGSDGEEEDEGGQWKRVTFTRVVSREEQERCDSRLQVFCVLSFFQKMLIIIPGIS